MLLIPTGWKEAVTNNPSKIWKVLFKNDLSNDESNFVFKTGLNDFNYNSTFDNLPIIHYSKPWEMLQK